MAKFQKEFYIKKNCQILYQFGSHHIEGRLNVFTFKKLNSQIWLNHLMHDWAYITKLKNKRLLDIS
jgi:hypothetical protein